MLVGTRCHPGADWWTALLGACPFSESFGAGPLSAPIDIRLLSAHFVLVCSAHLSVLISDLLGALLVLHQEGLNPVVVALLVDPIGDGGSGLGHLEPFAKGPGEALQQGAGQGPEGAVEVLDRLGIEGHLAGVGRG
jgi:hypothetical protein